MEILQQFMTYTDNEFNLLPEEACVPSIGTKRFSLLSGMKISKATFNHCLTEILEQDHITNIETNRFSGGSPKASGNFKHLIEFIKNG